MLTLLNRLCNFSLTFATPVAFQYIQWRVYMIFGSLCTCALIHTFFFFHETKGKTLEDMSAVFDSSTFAFGARGQKAADNEQASIISVAADSKQS